MTNKKCTRCEAVKNVTEFAKNSKSKDGFLNNCKDCSKEIKAARPSMRKAINDKCKECIYDPIGGNGTWVQQVRDCTSPECPLFGLRPGA
jgi:transposase-like protein